VPIDPDTSWSSNDHATAHSPGSNSLTDSPFLVHPYPSRKQAVTPPAMDSPTRRDLEGIYDRLMATSGVKRVGKGYQSSHIKPILINKSSSSSKSPGRLFHSTRRPMPPPVSSEDKFMTWTTDELGVTSSGRLNVDAPGPCEDRAGAARAVSRALKALVTVKKASRTS